MGDEAEFRARLAELEAKERTLSLRRRRLQQRIDFVRGHGVESETSLNQLLEQEREISEQRRDLHPQIDELRVLLGQAPGPRR
jgi:chromosome segregation ATPase